MVRLIEIFGEFCFITELMPSLLHKVCIAMILDKVSADKEIMATVTVIVSVPCTSVITGTPRRVFRYTVIGTDIVNPQSFDLSPKLICTLVKSCYCHTTVHSSKAFG